MAEVFTENSIKHGSAPGSLIFVGEQKMERPIIDLIQYNDSSINEKEVEDLNHVFSSIDTKYKNWININGLHDASVIESIGNHYKMDPLLLEDILDTRQRPKCEEYGDYLYIVLRMIRYDEKENSMLSEQFSMVLSSELLYTFQEIKGDVLNSVRNRIRKPKTKIKNRSLDYLAYALIDAIVDQYIYSIEKFGDKIEEIDQEILQDPKREILERINFYKKEVNYLRKVIRPVRELIFQLEKSDFLDKKNKPFIKDLLDHVTYATEAIETYRELLSDQLNIYHTSMSNKLNEIIRLLTIYSVIFIPLTFLAGIYGMNFKYLPELDYPYAYPIFWGVLIMISLSMVIYFKRKKWL